MKSESLSAEPAGSVAVRRRPTQARSQRRVEAILDAAQQLLVDHNPENLAMREIARKVGIPISSLYQYFPSKSGIIRSLVERNLEQVGLLLRREVERLLADYAGRPTIAQAVDRIVDAYLSHYRDHPQAVAVWAGAQADDELRRLDVIDTRKTAEFLVPQLMILISTSDRNVAHALALLIAEITGHAARLALALDPPLNEEITRQLKLMITLALERQADPKAAERPF